MQKPDAVVVGCIGIDTNVYFNGPFPDFQSESAFTSNFDCVGQAGGYASRSYASLGYETAILANVGEDPMGDWIRGVLEDEGIDCRGLLPDVAGTNRSVNLMKPDGGRHNFYDGRGNSSFDFDIARAREIMRGASLAHFNIPDWARRLLPVARELGLTIACDLQDAHDPGDPYRLDFVKSSDVIFFSAANFHDPGWAIGAYLGINPDALVVAGMGRKGCGVGRSGHGIRFFPAIGGDFGSAGFSEVSPSPFNPVTDTNGAGDCLAAGFLAAHVLEARSIEESVAWGQIAARHACSQGRGMKNMVTRGEINSVLRLVGYK